VTAEDRNTWMLFFVPGIPYPETDGATVNDFARYDPRPRKDNGITHAMSKPWVTGWSENGIKRNGVEFP
jgi:hypothetical protein